MAQDRRNPYVILGLDYGASADDAAVGFAKASRRLRSAEDVPFSLEDATWALHQIEQAVDNPDLKVAWYRVPADPAAYGYGDGPGILRPPPVNLERRSGDSAEAVRNLQNEVLNAHLIPEISNAAIGVPEVKAPRAVSSVKPQSSERPSLAIALVTVGLFLIALAVGAAVLLNQDEGAAPGHVSESTSTTVPPSPPAVALAWQEGACASIVEGVATLDECGPQAAVVEIVLPHSGEPLAEEEVGQLQFGLVLLELDAGDVAGEIPIPVLIAATSALGLPEGTTGRELLIAVRSALDPATTADADAHTIQIDPPLCGFLSYVERSDGLYCLLAADT
jgi:hypothetical protein